MLNPLIDAIFIVISNQQIHKVHTISCAVELNKVLPKLDKDPYKDLFKKNFLIMNALYQLQQELLNDGYYLHISSMHIQLCELKKNTPADKEALRDYYLDWRNYETSQQEIVELLDDFWQQLGTYKPKEKVSNECIKALCIQWDLKYPYDLAQLKKCWRQYAVAHHPDKQSGCTERFKQLKEEYELLKAHLIMVN
ncbi:DNA-J related domain-containing protein [Pseudoalteromonas sp. S16_S37]|uniref:DNA-J related domain-containing protein n=1 Tax=Pseudoalteromonas sp. S16_S37 TaxID=2720228 RepID=UPI001681C0B0|nr:DNA-J related domain-containing protein [Pseudoalteromonas sp. S16_S37]MBD1582678.1 molecular chaperone DnaJ [Pseudoalteromonas sp. S16_S37]